MENDVSRRNVVDLLPEDPLDVPHVAYLRGRRDALLQLGAATLIRAPVDVHAHVCMHAGVQECMRIVGSIDDACAWGGRNDAMVRQTRQSVA